MLRKLVSHLQSQLLNWLLVFCVVERRLHQPCLLRKLTNVHRLQLKKKLMPVWPSMQQTTLDSFTSGPKDNASRRDAVCLSIPVRVDLLVREHGTIEQDGDEQKHGCGYPAGAQRILPDQDGGQTINSSECERGEGNLAGPQFAQKLRTNNIIQF